ncbi:uncharacterized protein LOC143070943 [Mytilus galloprovincialis]|uniref:uncharacterized protein LOC143070943 n=1 Tax=Mytilus galloprovincialis TaxID=29158 RepID=UPI003F7C0481
MESDPTLNFIDIGANLGTYSLSFAKLGRKVIAIDALNLNVQKLCASVNQSHLKDVHFIMNAVSSRHETFPRVFIKMDIEGFEHKALERAYQVFFYKIFVQGIQIEWIFHRNKFSRQIIVNFPEQH